jgi:Ca-activated chloride channel family protein
MAALALTGLAEWLHALRCRRIERLAFGPVGERQPWTCAVPWLRLVAVGGLAWGLATLLLAGPQAPHSNLVPEGGYRHLILALDVSPSMQLTDAGAGQQQTRAKRANEVITSLLKRIAIEQVRVSIVAFYTGAKPVVVDTYDMEVVKNALDDLPLDIAFDPGKTLLLAGVRQAAELAKAWPAGSATLVIASDGDTIPDSGMPELPPAISQTLVVGVGDPRSGRYIDGHQSRQDTSTLRQLAGRLRGAYFDANEKHLPSESLRALSQSLPLRDAGAKGRREAALAAIAGGAGILAGSPVLLAYLGARRRVSPSDPVAPRTGVGDNTESTKGKVAYA